MHPYSYRSALSAFVVAAGLSAALADPAAAKDRPPAPTPNITAEPEASDDDLRAHYVDQMRQQLPMVGRLMRDHTAARGAAKPRAAQRLESATWTLQETMRAYYGVADNALPAFTVNGRLDKASAAALVRVAYVEGIEEMFVDAARKSPDEINYAALRDQVLKVAPDDYARSLRKFASTRAQEKALADYQACIAGTAKRSFGEDYIVKEAEKLKADADYVSGAMPFSCRPQLNALSPEQSRAAQLRYLTDRLGSADQKKPWCADRETGQQDGADTLLKCYEHNL